MTRSLDDIIVTCAITGAIHTPSMSPHLPVTPEEIIEDGVEAAQAGASVIHVHVRDPETGEPVSDPDLFEQVVGGIQDQTDAIVQPTTGGGMNQTVDERLQTIPAIEPELATFNTGSMNFGIYPLTGTVEEFEHDWEEEYLESTRDFIFPNTFGSLERALELFDAADTRPELECYDVGMLYNAKHLYDRGLLEPPIHITFVMGINGGIGADPFHLEHLAETADRLFGDDASWSVLGAGSNQFPLAIQAANMGANARVGLEDNLYIERGKLAESNAEQVEKMVDLAWEVTGREPADPGQVRDFLDLKGQAAVDV